MTFLVLLLVISVCVALIAWGLSSNDRMLQFPCLAGWTVLLLIVPQFVALMGAPDRVPSELLSKVMMMTLFCLSMTAAGYFVDSREPRVLSWQFDVRRLLLGSLALSIVGFGATVMLNRLPEEMLNDSQWTGLPVRYLFFAQAMRYGSAIALIVFAKYRSRWGAWLMMPGVIETLRLMIFAGRRTVTAIFFLTILCAIWFNRRKMVPRWAMVAGILAFSVFVYSIGAYRMAMKKNPSIRKVLNIEMKNPLNTESLVGNMAIEMENAARIMEATDVSGEHDFGVMLYNSVIAAYVPRQLVGDDFKRSLMGKSDLLGLTLEHAHYKPPTGSCTTGIADSYYSFSYFGSLLFAMIGWVMRRLWEGSMRGSIIYQLIYTSTLALFIGAYNGGIANLIVPWVHMMVFMGPILFFARLRSPVGGEGGGGEQAA